MIASRPYLTPARGLSVDAILSAFESRRPCCSHGRHCSSESFSFRGKRSKRNSELKGVSKSRKVRPFRLRAPISFIVAFLCFVQEYKPLKEGAIEKNDSEACSRAGSRLPNLSSVDRDCPVVRPVRHGASLSRQIKAPLGVIVLFTFYNRPSEAAWMSFNSSPADDPSWPPERGRDSFAPRLAGSLNLRRCFIHLV